MESLSTEELTAADHLFLARLKRTWTDDAQVFQHCQSALQLLPTPRELAEILGYGLEREHWPLAGEALDELRRYDEDAFAEGRLDLLLRQNQQEKAYQFAESNVRRATNEERSSRIRTYAKMFADSGSTQSAMRLLERFVESTPSFELIRTEVIGPRACQAARRDPSLSGTRRARAETRGRMARRQYGSARSAEIRTRQADRRNWWRC